MKTRYRPSLFALLVPALCLVSVSAVVEAAQAKPTRWSDRATWPGRKVPVAGDKVVIEAGKEVILDVSPPQLNGLTINGKLTFADTTDLELTTEWIMLHGELAIGTEAKPHTRKATITLTDTVKEEEMMGMGDRGIMLSGGTLNLHGDRTNSWTKLTKTAEAGSSSIEVMNAAGWRVGDKIVLASTDYDPRQAEVRTIAALSGNTLTLDKPLAYMHFGKITFDIDQRGEVGLLTRNIKVHASADAEQSFFGGHIMAMVTSKLFIEGVELHRMGQNLELARYPIHWHLVGDAKGQYVRNTAIHDTFNRCVTVHGTHNVQVENNVTYNNVGHCFFLEDGIEHGNQFVRNLAIQTKCHTSKPCDPTNLAPFGATAGTNFNLTGQNAKDVLIPSDNTVSSFWITNPDNTYRDNVAAGSDSTGFWLAFPEHPTGAFEGSDQSKNTWPRRMAVREFKGNVAHSNFDSFMGDRAPRADGKFAVGGYVALANPADPNSAQVENVIEDFTAYKNRNSGIWARGELRLYRNLKMADNGIGFTQASGNLGRSKYTSRVVDSRFVGETENIGNPVTEAEKKAGRSLPFPEVADFPIRGYEFYDFHHELDNNTFVNYEDNATRKTGAISYLLFTSFGMSSNNTVSRSKFINAKPVYFPPIDNRWSNDDYGNTVYKTSVFNDRDGTITGVANSYIVNITGIDVDDQCEVKPTWNAAVCKGDIGRMNVGGGFGAVGFGGFGGGGAPGAGPPAAGPPAAAPPRAPAAAPVAFKIAPGGGRIRGTPAPAGPPVMLSRNGKEFQASGETNVRAGTEYKVTTERPSVNINVKELDAGSWVMFELPGFTTASAGTATDSLDALRKASATSYYKGKDALWVKVVSTGDVMGSGPTQGKGPGETLQVSR
ncbi:MAG: G8 domain-containing protein [Proteobacteria bacterium]|jgi:cell migration-inducing and hyaluronan-binding protein|nr:G8 domain-containing protein [Pseudomonadota bacterium]